MHVIRAMLAVLAVARDDGAVFAALTGMATSVEPSGDGNGNCGDDLRANGGRRDIPGDFAGHSARDRFRINVSPRWPE